ncbi:MAG TPA: FAD-dependent monooxygenase [Vicinamibacteria bacterium]|nr:FAD-dependent monooxygenase [Vicinamibacteria bacterium]
MSTDSRTDVLVVGAGPTGLLAALRLAQEGLSVQVIDEEWRPAGHSYALALHSRSLALLDRLGLAAEAIGVGRRLDTAALYEGHDRRATLRFEGSEGFAFLLALPQSVLEDLLVRRLSERGVRVRWSHRLAGLEAGSDEVAAKVHRLAKESTGYAVAHTEWVVERELTLRAAFVVGADGHRSLVRRALGTPFEETAPSQAFAVVECGGRPGHEMQLVLDDATVSALWPLPGSRARWTFELEAPEASADDRFKSRLSTRVGERHFPHLDEARVRALVRERAPWFEEELRELGWSIEVRFERRLASSFGQGRVWLAGDAAHLTGPAGMQSMNAGLDEAHDLAGRIVRVLRGGEGHEVLEGYGAERRAAWRFLLGLQGGLRAGARALPFAAENAGRLLPCLPATGEDLGALAAQLGLAVEEG